MNLTDREMLIKVWGMLEKFDMAGGKELAKEIQDHLEKVAVVIPPKISIRREPFDKDNSTPCKPIPMPPYVWPYQKWEPSDPIYFKRTTTDGTIKNTDNYLYDQKNP